MGVFTVGGREVVAELFQAETFFLAIGNGDPAWDTEVSPPSAASTDLVAKVGVTRVRQSSFVVADPEGDITMSDGTRWTVSATPTRYVYLSFKLDLTDAQPETLREAGVFHDTQLAPAVPAGQFYIPHASVTDYGTLVHVDRFNSIVRDGTMEQSFNVIFTL